MKVSTMTTAVTSFKLDSCFPFRLFNCGAMECHMNIKRPASPTDDSLTNARASKRQRPNEDASLASAPATLTNVSVCDLLSIPLEVIFREVSPSLSSASSVPAVQAARRKPVMTRAEAGCFLRVSQLAHQVDSLVQVSSEALKQKVLCQSLGKELVQYDSVPLLLRSLVPLLGVLGHHQPDRALQAVKEEMDQTLQEFSTSATQLRQYADQNWTLAENMLDAFGEEQDSVGLSSSAAAGQTLAREKRLLGELQEELATRVESIVGMTAINDLEGLGDGAATKSVDSHRFVSMREFCRSMFNLDESHQGSEDDSSERESSEQQAGELSQNHADSSRCGSQDLLESETDHRRNDSTVAESPSSPSREYNSLYDMSQATHSAVTALAGLSSRPR